MSWCDGLISKGLEQGDCSNRPVKGFEHEALLINRADIDWSGVTYSTTNPNVVTALPLRQARPPLWYGKGVASRSAAQRTPGRPEPT